MLLLTRAEWIDHANPALFEHVSDGRRQQVQDDLKRTHEVYNEYAEAFPQHVYRVLTEDMFDMQVGLFGLVGLSITWVAFIGNQSYESMVLRNTI